MVKQRDNKDSEVRAQRVEEQLKFREELRELIRSKKSKAGPDIANLHQRYTYQVEPDKYDYALQIWKYARRDEQWKVNYLRRLGVPETAILEFICSSFHAKIGMRGGPRDEDEVRVRAAYQLLHYDIARAGAGQVQEGGAGVGAAAPARKTVVSTPR